MNQNTRKSLIERVCESIGLLKSIEQSGEFINDHIELSDEFSNYPPPEKWDDWTEYDANAWPRRVKRNYSIVPTTCFNCESACGLLAYIDKDSGTIKRFEGNPQHPASRGRTCAKGPATINQINDTERILYPLKRKG